MQKMRFYAFFRDGLVRLWIRVTTLFWRAMLFICAKTLLSCPNMNLLGFRANVRYCFFLFLIGSFYFQIPASGSVVNIEKSVLLDVTSLTLGELNVVGSGRLIFSDDVGDITITADGILVKVTFFQEAKIVH